MMDEIIIAPHNFNWSKLFVQEAELLKSVLDTGIIKRIEHFGSTAVPGLAAKPVIDLLIEVSTLNEAKQAVIVPLNNLGYAYWENNPDPRRMFFVKGLPPNGPRTHHIHMVEADSPLWERLIFRDYLRNHPQVAQSYEQLKYQLANKFRHDREAYTQGKLAFIKHVMRTADTASAQNDTRKI